MPKGGARPNAGRKPKPLAQKLAEGNPGKRPLKKVEFENTTYDPSMPPDYLDGFEKRTGSPVKVTPTDIYKRVIAYLEPSECLHLIPEELIQNWVMANYHVKQAYHELSMYPNVTQDSKGKMITTDFFDVMTKMQKRVEESWKPIWEIISRNSERTLGNPDTELLMTILGNKVRKQRGSGI
jgi:hypothetical protein